MLYDKVYNTIEQNGLIPKHSKVIAAVSGGADSVCLLDVLAKLSEKLEITLECAHLNHNLRGEESDADEQYVKELCERYSVKLHTKSVDIAAISKGRSIEDVARTERYQFFDELCQDSENTYIATAHTVNDNTETFFINMLRGSGSRGLCGIPIKRGKIIRPLLDVSRSEIIGHLTKAQLEYQTDSTNSDTSYLRNFIRHEVIPVFEKRTDINIFKSVSKVTENLLSENEALDAFAKKSESDKISELSKLEDAVLYRVLTKKLEKEFDIILDSTHFYSVKSLICNGGIREQIKGDIYAVCEKGRFRFERSVSKNQSIQPIGPGENRVGEKIILIKSVKEFNKGLTKFLLDCDKIVGNLSARARRSGDSFRPLGRNSSGKLSKLLKNDGVSAASRDSLLVICDSTENVVFVESYGVSREFAATEQSKNILSIEIIGNYGGK